MESRKIKNLEELAKIVQGLKKKGKKIAHCHGCFDLLHIGHMKHFEAAKEKADVLIVTVTPDKYVNKGPGRPHFNENLRLEALAALSVVDYVALNNWPTAKKTIQLLKPDYFVKGSDYKDMSSDVTGNIYKEKDAVEGIGGELLFTDEITFSSSSILNQFFDVFRENTRYYIAELKEEHTAEEIIANIDKLRDIKVLVVGDVIIDEYVYCRPMGRVEKAPIISTKWDSEETFTGGSLAISKHLAQLSDHVGLLATINEKDLEWLSKEIPSKIKTHFISNKDITTVRKRRYIAKTPSIFQKMFEINYLEDKRMEDVEKQVVSTLKKVIGQYDLVIIADFGHGLLTKEVINTIMNSGKFVAVNAQTNSSNYGYNYITKYHTPDYISIDENEMRLPFQDKYGDIQKLIEELVNKVKCRKINVTLGSEGSIYFEKQKHHYVPALAGKVVDTVGAGDAVLSITSLLAYSNCPAELIPFIGNCSGAIAVTIVGNKEPVSLEKLKMFISAIMK
ncbi:MAG: adenylyltransferase/cytidyltransferase family protein [Candidatus Altiarchaeales archaeon]|nr:adenylyltransferase/cytidyltransferase family protein [Candidatus Altiarchaeales archaeon]